jgi:hypothetical protein
VRGYLLRASLSRLHRHFRVSSTNGMEYGCLTCRLSRSPVPLVNAQHMLGRFGTIIPEVYVGIELVRLFSTFFLKVRTKCRICLPIRDYRIDQSLHSACACKHRDGKASSRYCRAACITTKPQTMRATRPHELCVSHSGPYSRLR